MLGEHTKVTVLSIGKDISNHTHTQTLNNDEDKETNLGMGKENIRKVFTEEKLPLQSL